MDTYTLVDLQRAWREVGLSTGSVVYLSSRLFGLGQMKPAADRETFLAQVYSSIRAVIGDEGTLVVPTFTQQVGQFGVPYVHEETPCRTGILGEYVRQMPSAVRSLHPVFSVTAIGARAHEICDDISPVAFGAESSFDRLIRMGAKTVCAGFPFESGHIVSLMHRIEAAFAVPYYYNKLVPAETYRGGRKQDVPFVINVKYLAYDVRFDYLAYLKELQRRRLIASATVGGGVVYGCGAREQFDVGIEMLKQNPYAFLAHPPRYVAGQIPSDGPPNSDAQFDAVNWVGFDLVRR